jgi:allophanate hydrolase subunit 2
VSTAPKLQVVYVAGLATVQDLGRRGYRALGVPVSGALDRLSAAYANALVGNSTGYGVLEVFGSVRLRLMVDAVVAVTGGYPRVVVEGVEVAPWTPIYCRAGSEVSVVPTGRGFVHYVAISGGILCEEVMGSASTYVRGGFGCPGEGPQTR